MYFSNGFACGGRPDEIIRLVDIKPLEDRMLLIEFSSGEHRLFDATVLDGPVYQPLQDEKVFRNVKLDHGIATWNDGDIDCAPEFMYENSYEYMKVS